MKDKIRTTIVLLESASAYIISEAVILKTNPLNIATATDDMKTNIHGLINCSNNSFTTPM